MELNKIIEYVKGSNLNVNILIQMLNAYKNESEIDWSKADVTAADVTKGKKFYSNGKLMAGTRVEPKKSAS